MYKFWTTREEEKLLSMIDDYNIREIADELGRSYWGVRNKISKFQESGLIGRKKYLRDDMISRGGWVKA